MNGLAITIFVGQLPKLCGFSTDADGFVDELQAFVDGFPDRNPTALWLGLATLAVLLAAPAVHPDDPGGARRGHRRHGGHRRCSISTSRRSAPCREGLPSPALPWTSVERRRTDAGRRRRHHPGVAHRHHRHLDGVRGPTRRGGQARPGDDRHRLGQHRGRVLPGFRRVDEQLTHGGGRSVRREEPAHRSGRCRHGRAAAAVLQRAPQESPADRARRRRDRRGVLAGRPRDAAPLPRASAGVRSYLSLVATGGVVFFGVLQGILIAVVLSILLFFRRSWWPHGEVLGQIDGEAGWHSAHDGAVAEETPRHRSCSGGKRRCSSPTPACSASRCATSFANATHGGSSCSARRSPTSTSPRPTCWNSSTSS